MKEQKNIGVWLDHATADLLEVSNNKNNRTINSSFTHKMKEEALSRSENIMHNKEQQMHEAFYKEIAAELKAYQHILLFGPTNAKMELQNYLNKDLHFKDVKIDIHSADKMSIVEKTDMVKKHFMAHKV